MNTRSLCFTLFFHFATTLLYTFKDKGLTGLWILYKLWDKRDNQVRKNKQSVDTKYFFDRNTSHDVTTRVVNLSAQRIQSNGKRHVIGDRCAVPAALCAVSGETKVMGDPRQKSRDSFTLECKMFTF